MSRYDLFGFSIEIDDEINHKYYKSASEWDCECVYCRNFIMLAKEKKLPEQVRKTLDMLGIPAEKATYVCEVIPKDDGHLYQFSYRLAGELLEGEPSKVFPWGEVRFTHEIYPFGAPDFPKPHFDLEFWIVLPMIIE